MTQQLGREPLRMGKGWDATSVASGKEDLVRHPLAHTASHRRIKARHPQSPTTTGTGSEGPEHWPQKVATRQQPMWGDPVHPPGAGRASQLCSPSGRGAVSQGPALLPG